MESHDRPTEVWSPSQTADAQSAAPQSAYQSPTDIFPGEPPKKKSWVPTCLIGCFGILLVMLILFGIGGYLAATKGPAMLAKAVHTGLVDAIRESDIPDEEKTEVIHQLDRVLEAVQNGEVDLDDVKHAVEELTESPLLGAGLLTAVEAKYLDPSGLSDEEKAAATRALERVWRGFVEKDLDFESLRPIIKFVAEEKSEGNWQLKDKVSDEDLRAMIETAQSLADEHEIPDEPFEIRLSTEVKKLVDDILGPEDLETENLETEILEPAADGTVDAEQLEEALP